MTIEGILTSLGIGLLSTTSPCVLPLYPGFLAYISGNLSNSSKSRTRYFLGVFVLAGVLTMMLLLGLFISLISVSVGEALAVIIPLADTAIILMGVGLLFNYNIFKKIPQINVPLLKNPYVNAFVYGLFYGPIALPCSGPFIVSIFTYSLTATELISKMGIFFWFGIGFGIPLLVLSLLSGTIQNWLVRQFTQRARLINVIGGILLIGVGFYDFITNWENIQIILGF